jgi:Arc/MetJ family transcription regulator
MEAVIRVDEDLLDRARRASGIDARDEVVREALTVLIQREVARKLIERAGTEPEIEAPVRRRQQAG